MMTIKIALTGTFYPKIDKNIYEIYQSRLYITKYLGQEKQKIEDSCGISVYNLSVVYWGISNFQVSKCSEIVSFPCLRDDLATLRIGV
jgi:hypothetical protein